MFQVNLLMLSPETSAKQGKKMAKTKRVSSRKYG
ncbi:hypothetical protein V6Z11_A08G263000 [Gossypium hirsutum]